MKHTLSFSQLFGRAGLIILVWMVVAVFNSSEFYRRTVDQNWQPNLSWSDVLTNQLVVSSLWALFTPLIIGIAERFPLVKPFRWPNAVVLLAVTPALAIFRAAFGGAVLVFVERGTTRQYIDMIAYSIEVRWHRNAFLILLIVGVVNLVLAQRAAAESERKALAQKKENADAELQRIRAALQPQFLFATLEAVKAHVTTSPFVADGMLVKLGAVLRQMLEFQKRNDVSLGEELELVDHCLELERARTGGVFTTSVDVDRSLLGARLPPLLLYSIVESAVLAESQQRGRLEISAWQEDGTLRVIVRTTDPQRAPGVAALDATRARLTRAYADRAAVEARTEAGGSVTIMSMPLHRG